jgi:hypothetical protein
VFDARLRSVSTEKEPEQVLRIVRPDLEPDARASPPGDRAGRLEERRLQVRTGREGLIDARDPEHALRAEQRPRRIEQRPWRGDQEQDRAGPERPRGPALARQRRGDGRRREQKERQLQPRVPRLPLEHRAEEQGRRREGREVEGPLGRIPPPAHGGRDRGRGDQEKWIGLPA